MTERFEDVLDAALAQMKDDPVTAVLSRYPDQAETLAPLLATAEKMMVWQTAVQATPDPDWQSADRAAFLAQIEQLPVTAVSPNPLLRLKKWLTQTRTALRNQHMQKEQKPMNILFARAVATALVLFGLGGGTVALANDSLPDTPLYPVKLMLEESRMALANTPVEQATLQMNLAEVRLQEMTQLVQTGDPVTEPLVIRLETHLQEALQLAAQTGDPDLVGLLTQMQTMLQTEQQTMAQLSDPAQTMFGNVNQILNRYQEQIQAGLDDPTMFRWQQSQGGNGTPAGNGRQNGQDIDNGQNGPGDGTCTGDCDPVGDENKYGQDQDNGQNGSGQDENPGNNNNNGNGAISPSSGQNGNGAGDGICDNNCDPVGDENKYGQDDANSGQNGSGDGDGICDGDCDPVGDENHYGQDGTNAGQTGSGNGDGVCLSDCEPVGDGPHPNQGNENGGNSGNNNGNGNGG